LERVVALMDELFAIDRGAREQKLSLDDRHALRQDRAAFQCRNRALAVFLERRSPDREDLPYALGIARTLGS
jgi:hypothetical protein